MGEVSRLHPSQDPVGGADRAESASTVAPRAAGVRVFADGELVCERFRIVRFIGGGGMGQVYEAQDLELGEPVALKAIRPEFAWNEEALARFRREIQLSRRVTHPNVCVSVRRTQGGGLRAGVDGGEVLGQDVWAARAAAHRSGSSSSSRLFG